MSEATEHLRDSTVSLRPGSLLDTLGSTLRFEYHGGGVSPLEQGHTTGWRTMPFALSAHNPYGEGFVEYEDGRREIGSGDRAGFIRAGVRHLCALTSKKGLSRWSHFNFLVFGKVDLFSLVEPRSNIKGPAAARIGDINEDLWKLSQTPQPSLQTIARRQVLGMELLELLLSQTQMSGVASKVQQSQRLLAAIEHVHHNLHRTITLEELAECVFLSPSRFHAVFRETMGIAPRDYIVKQRMQKAQELLLTTPLQMSEVGERVGYESEFHFSRTFKKHSGISPSRYRENLRAQAG